MPTLHSRFLGCMVGLAAGDAVGTTLEFRPPGTFEPIDDMVGGGPFLLSPGQWTDDTSMALCLADSLLDCNGFDAGDQMQRYCRWWRNGYMSSTGRCFDIGNTVAEALRRFQASGEPYSGSTNPFSAGNGSLMRLAPVVLFYHPDLGQILQYAGESSRTTHGAPECVDACRYFASLLYLALNGATREQIQESTLYSPSTAKVDRLMSGAYSAKTQNQLRGSGYVIESLEAALWCFYNTEDFPSAILAAANLGDDADTTAAICGQLSGAFYGIEGIKVEWVEKLAQLPLITEMAGRLYRHASGPGSN